VLAACTSGRSWEHPQLGAAYLRQDLDECSRIALDHAQQAAAAQPGTALSPLKSAPARAGEAYVPTYQVGPVPGSERVQSRDDCMRSKGYQRAPQ
jgi:hypothetical protein